MKTQFLDALGNPVSNGQLTACRAYSKDPLPIFASPDLTVASSGMLDAEGYGEFFLNLEERYRIVLYDSQGRIVMTKDDVVVEFPPLNS